MTESITHNGVQTTLMEFTPEAAEKILRVHNLKNRKISRCRLTEYTKAMNEGRWHFNGDAIRFYDDDSLADGQHRLTAIVKSKTSQTFLCIEGLKDLARNTIDTGKSRSGGDVLALEAGVGANYAGSISLAIKLHHAYTCGRAIHDSYSSRLDNQQVIDGYHADKETIDYCVEWLKEHIPRWGRLLPFGEQLFLMMVFSKIDQDQAEKFMLAILDGINIEHEGSEYYLHKLLNEIKSKTINANRQVKLQSCIKVWNSVRKDRKMSSRTAAMWTKREEHKVAI